MAAGASLRPGEGLLGTQFLQDGLCHTLDICQNIVVPEAQHAPVVIFKPLRTPGIVRVVNVLAAVNLNDEPTRYACEISDERTDRSLPAEFVALKLPIAQSIPKPALGVGRVLAQLSGLFTRHRQTLTRLRASPSAHPLPQAGEG